MKKREKLKRMVRGDAPVIAGSPAHKAEMQRKTRRIVVLRPDGPIPANPIL
jgi:hypothetical protein